MTKKRKAIVPISNNLLLTKYTPRNYIVNRNIRSFKDVLSQNTKEPTLTSISKDNGPQFVEGIIMGYLVFLNEEILNLSQPMTEIQIEYAAQMIVDEFHYLKLPDIVLIMKMIIRHDFGQLYGSLDPHKLLGFVREYNERRQQYARQHKKQRIENEEVENFIKQNVKKINKL